MKALLTATGLLVLGVSARLGLVPPPAMFEWQDAGEGGAGLDELRRDVEAGMEREERASLPLAPGERLNPNVASLEDLQRLPGIGPARAAEILEERQRSGGFRSPSDLTRVTGIGPTMLRRLTPYLQLPESRSAAGPTRPSAVPRSAAPDARARRIDVNRAQINDLEQITGIGPVLARRILETRRRLGGFRRIEDLLAVPGIGRRKLQEIRDQVRLR